VSDPLVLRRTTAHDAYALWLWRNEEESRRVSFEQAPIGWAEHVDWLRDRLDDAGAIVLVAEFADGRPVGSIRFDTQDDWRTARLSFVLAPEVRGQGLARPLVLEGVQYLRGSHPRAAIHAEVRSVNERSLRVFRGAGWIEDASSDGCVRFWSRDRVP